MPSVYRLPDRFVVMSNGKGVKHFSGAFDLALEWVRATYNLTGALVSIKEVGMTDNVWSRPDQRVSARSR
jgi:hypothetical protein